MTSSLGTTVTNLDDRRRCASRGGELGKGLVLTEGYPHHIPTSKSRPAACLLPGIDTSGGREWFNPNRVWTAPPLRAVILLGCGGPDPVSRKAHDLVDSEEMQGFVRQTGRTVVETTCKRAGHGGREMASAVRPYTVDV